MLGRSRGGGGGFAWGKFLRITKVHNHHKAPLLETHYEATPGHTLSPIKRDTNLFTTGTARQSPGNNNSRSAPAICPYMGVDYPPTEGRTRVYEPADNSGCHLLNLNTKIHTQSVLWCPNIQFPLAQGPRYCRKLLPKKLYLHGLIRC